METLRPASVIQRASYLRPVDVDPTPAPGGAPATAAVARDGVRLRRPETPAMAAPPGIRSGGHDVAGDLRAVNGSIRIDRLLGEPWRAAYRLRVDTTPTPAMITTDDGREVVTEDGREVIAEDIDLHSPGLLEIVRFAAPTTAYRDLVLDTLDPILYWSLDSRDREQADDYSASGVNRGVIDLSQTALRQAAPVPYGGAAMLAGANAVTGPGLPASSALTFMGWIKAGGACTPFTGAGVSVTATAAAIASGGVSAALTPGWRHFAVVWSSAATTIWLDGVQAAAGAAAALSASASVSLGGPCSLDEVSVHGRALTAAEIAACYAARNGRRIFAGVVKRIAAAGRGAGSERADYDVNAVGLDEVFKVARVHREFTSDGSETVRQVIQRLLDDELPDQPITADGVDVDAIVAPMTENLDTVHRVITHLATLHQFVWHLDPHGEIVAHLRSDAPASGAVLDEELNLAIDPPPLVTDARLFRSQQLLSGTGGRPETDTFTSDGERRFFVLRQRADFDQGVVVEVDGAAQSVDAAGQFEFEADWAADAGTNAMVIPSSRQVPRAGARIVVRYTSDRAQVVSVADIDAIRRYGLRSSVVFDPTANAYTRREALSAALLAGNASPTRQVTVRGRIGRIPLPTPGRTYVLDARGAYGLQGGAPWLCVAAACATDDRFRMRVTLDLQQGPYRPMTADYYDRLADQDAKLIPAE